MSKFVQAIVISNSSILYMTKYGENNQITNRPLNREINDGETPVKAVEELIKEQLGTSCEVLFKLGRELYNNTTTFLVNINNKDSIKEAIEDKGLRWVSFYDRNLFSYNDKIQLSYLLLSCIDNNYIADWMEPVKEIILSDSRLSITANTLEKKLCSKIHKQIDAGTGMKEKTAAIFIAIALGFICNQSFFNGNYGISYPIFTLLVILSFLYKHKKDVERVKPFGVFLLCTAFIICMNYSIHSNIILSLLNLMAVPILITASFLIIRYEEIKWDSIGFMFSVFNRIIPAAFENILKPILFISSGIKNKGKRELNPQSKGILIGLLLSIPLLIIIIPLLSSADSVFGYYTNNFYRSLININIGNTLWDIIRIIILASYLFGFLWSFRYSYKGNNGPSKVNGSLEPVTVITVLVVINLVYLLFTIIQFSYLYGGEKVLPNGFTYAEYARRGFFELILVTVINFTILIMATKYTKRKNNSYILLNIFYTLLIGFTFNMLYSAHYKMSLYESAFGYTYLRIFVHFFLMLLLILFVIALSGIWIKKVPVAKLSIIAALLMYVFINYANVDSIIARKNIERYYSTGKIDIHYISQLSYDAVPQVIEFLKENTGNDSLNKYLNDYIARNKNQLSRNRKWYEFNYSRYMAEKVLNEN